MKRKYNQVEEMANVAWLKAKNDFAFVMPDSDENLVRMAFQLGFTYGFGCASDWAKEGFQKIVDKLGEK